jgi:hypothetical protein
VHRDPFGRRYRVGSSDWGLGGGGDGEGCEYRLAHGLGEPRVAFLGWGGDESERDAGARCVDQVRGVSDIDAEPPGLGDAGDEPVGCTNSIARSCHSSAIGCAREAISRARMLSSSLRHPRSRL